MKRYYGQVYEDKVLLSALGHVDRGFYIDVGAQQPEYHSVTKVFYDRGWNGINVEPVSRWFDQLSRERPRDINLRLVEMRPLSEICKEYVRGDIHFLKVDAEGSEPLIFSGCDFLRVPPVDHSLRSNGTHDQ